MKPNAGQFKKGFTPWNNGKKWSKVVRKKMSKARNRFYARGGKHPLEGTIRLDMRGENNLNAGKFGKAHPRWTEDKKAPFYKSIRQLFKYRQWRSDIFTRDNFTCVFCGARGCYLEADHCPKMFIEIINEYNIKTIKDALACEELWNVNNGRTLCTKCHRQTDTWGRSGIKFKQKWFNE